MRKKFLTVVYFICVLLVSCESQKASSSKEIPPVPVAATTPSFKDITLYIDSIGTLFPLVFTEIRPQVDGTIQEVLVFEGDWIQKGTPLFAIDPALYRMKVQETTAQLAINQASLQAAQKKLNRFKPLVQKNLIPQTEWDDLESQVAMSSASIELDQARLNIAKLDLEHCVIKSPIDGRVGKLDLYPGMAVIANQTPLALISKMDRLFVEFSITEKEFSQLPQDLSQIEIQCLCSPNRLATGKVTFLDNHFDAKTGLLVMRGTIENPAYTLRPGQSVRIRMPVATQPHLMLIPQKAIRYNEQGPYIYVIQPDRTVALRQLVLGDEYEEDQIVLGGLDATEELVIDGHLRLFPGLKVEIKS